LTELERQRFQVFATSFQFPFILAVIRVFLFVLGARRIERLLRRRFGTWLQQLGQLLQQLPNYYYQTYFTNYLLGYYHPKNSFVPSK